MMFVSLKPRNERKLSQSDIIKSVRKDFKKQFSHYEVIVQDLSLRGFAASRGFPIEFIVQGADWDELQRSTIALMKAMKESLLFVDVNTDIQEKMPELHIVPDREKLAYYGVSLQTLTRELNTLFGGAILTGSNEYPKGQHRYEIEVRLNSQEYKSISDLKNVKVRNNLGQLIALSDVVKQEQSPNLMVISRLNRVRAITVYANPAPGHSQSEVMKKLPELAKKVLSLGCVMKPTGSSQGFMEAFYSLIMALVLGVVFSYMVLASQFNSFVYPFSVLMALPFSISGAFIALYLLHQSINMYSMIGLILLMGIAKKNSILLVDFTNYTRTKNPGLSLNQALIEACPVRLRPIIMTSVATIVGALPAAMSFGPGSESTKPMAVAIMGGVIASTFLTLFVVPVVYHLLSRFERPKTLF
jgi:HAE1 family hydrophobic/amphiphilic exporter-1